MKMTQSIQLRRFIVHIRDERTGEIVKDKVVFTKQQLQAAQMVGESSLNLIRRLYNRKGFRVVDTLTTEKREITLDLEALWKGRYEDEQGAPVDLMGVLNAIEGEGKAIE